MTLHKPKAPCDLDVVDQVLPLFGTVANAQRLLRLQHLDYVTARAAFHGNPVTEDVRDEVIEAWRVWKQLFVRGHVLGLCPDLSFRLPEEMDDAYTRLKDLKVGEQDEVARIKK